MKKFVIGRIKSVGFAVQGAWHLLHTEHSIRVQVIIASFIIFAGFQFNISATEWALQVFSIGLLLTTEGLNTAVEKIADFIHPEHHPKIGLIKDIAAGAVFLSFLTGLIVLSIIYVPLIINQ